MTKSVSYSDARANLAKLWDTVVDDREAMRLTRRGKEDIAILPADELSSLIESIHLLRSKNNAERLISALNASKNDNVNPSTLTDLTEELL